MKKSTHKVEIVPIVLEKHPNADTLSIVKIFNYICVVKTDDWKDKKLGAYIPPDSLVPNKEPFKFLFKPTEIDTDYYRIRVKKYRGVVSQGLLIHVPDRSKEGDDVADFFNIKHYEPEIKSDSIRESSKYKKLRKYAYKFINFLKFIHFPNYWVYKILFNLKIINGLPVIPPACYVPDYDVDSIFRYISAFKEGELIRATEKIHGTSAKFVYSNGKFNCGSHHTWRPKSPSDVYWKIFKKYSELSIYLMNNPDTVVYGEIYGYKIQYLTYDCYPSEIKFKVFDILKNGRWLNAEELSKECTINNLPYVPIVVDNYPFNFENLKKLAEIYSLLNSNQIREGLVIKPMIERHEHSIGRVNLKLVSNTYLEKSK